MFISIPDPENVFEEDVGIYASRFNFSEDLCTVKRNIIIHNDLDFNKSSFEGIHTLKCTIINLSVLDGRFHHDTVFNPETVLSKTVYNGYIHIPLGEINGEFKVTKDLLSKCKFKPLNAYTSCLGVWSINSIHDTIKHIGFSLFDMMSLRLAKMGSNFRVDVFGGELALKIDVSFDGTTTKSVLPLPYPMYYSRLHSTLNGDVPVMSTTSPIRVDELCDEYTSINLVKFDRLNPRGELDYRYDNDNNSETVFIDKFDKIYEVGTESMPLHVSFSMIRSLSDEIFLKIFSEFGRYQLSSMNFIFDSAKDIFVIPSMTFSYNMNCHTKEFAEEVIFEITHDTSIKSACTDLSNYYGDCAVIGRITDLKYDVNIVFRNGHKDHTNLKTIKYASSIFDMVQNSSFNTNVTSPLIMI